jgi:glutathione S-transferase
MLHLYGSPHNRSFRTFWLLEELGLEYEVTELDTQAGACRTPEFLAINPNGHVPTLVDGDTTIWESMAINLYLVRKHGGPLAPRTLEDEAQLYQWSFWAMTEAETPLLNWGMHTHFFPEEMRDAAIAKEAGEQLATRFAVLEGALGKSDYLAGVEFGLVDLNVAAVCSWVDMMHFDLAACPRTRAWLDRCLARPAARKVSAMSAPA